MAIGQYKGQTLMTGGGPTAAGGPPAPTPGLGAAGTILQIAGAASGAISSYYAAKGRQYELRSQALSEDYLASLSYLNARRAETAAQAALEAGQQRRGLSDLRYAQVRADIAASQAARGIQAGVGSAAEIDASVRFSQELDAITIDVGAMREANRARAAAVDLRNRGLMAGVSADNLRMAARSINPYLSAGTSLLTSASQMLRS